jgi:hypothetical protein
MQPISYARHQFPAEIIRHARWLYLRFTLSYRDVEELLAERGHRDLLRDRPALGSEVRDPPSRAICAGCGPDRTARWLLDEMVVSIQGRRMYLWRAVDSEGEVLDRLVQAQARHQGCPAAHEQTAQEAGLCARRARDRQAGLLWSGSPRAAPVVPPRAGPAQEQQGGELSSAGTTARAQAASASCRGISQRFLSLMPPSTTPSTVNATSSPAARSGRSEPRRPLHGRQPRRRRKRARHPDLCDFASVSRDNAGLEQITSVLLAAAPGLSGGTVKDAVLYSITSSARARTKAVSRGRAPERS